MIEQIYSGIPELLSDTYYGRKILAAYNAYGSGYDFCRFYFCGNGVIHVYNNAMVLDGDVDTVEAEMFINMTKPVTAEIGSDKPLHLDELYIPKHRTLFKVIPKETDISFDSVKVNSFPEKCFEILREGFDMKSYDEWYVDISHRIRHGVAELYLYDDTTVTRQFDICGFVFLSHIATAAAVRGKGTARRLLYCLGNEAEKQGKGAYLFALDHRRSFYESIGFEPIYEDILYEMKG